MNLKRLYHIMRTSRFVAAVFGEQRRNKPLVDFNENYHRKGDDLVKSDFQNSAKIRY